jgi:uncharacterized pyridoxamine 5'-phosphate oxidase family protein/DNA-binding XRE family transcriptional regulator
MRTGEKIAFLRKRKGLTQEQMAEILEVSRQSVSRWEIDMAFPETEKLIKLSRLLECSVDFLLNESEQEIPKEGPLPSVNEAYHFIRDCGYFFLATVSGNMPNQRPMGMIYCDEKNLFIGTDRRNNVFTEIMNNPHISLVSYNLHTRKWIRVTGDSFEETSIDIYNAMRDSFPMLKQKYIDEDEVYFTTLRVNITSIEIN